MKIVNPIVNMWGYVPLDLDSTLKRIEEAGRTCYNSIDKIKPGSARKFVENVLKPVPPHASVLEHSNMVLVSKYAFSYPVDAQRKLRAGINSDFLFTGIQHDHVYLYGNWRAFQEEHIDIDFFNLPEQISKHYPRYEVVENIEDVPDFAKAVTFYFKTDRAVLAEITRHRAKVAFSVRSQRYCNESNLEIIEPYWLRNKDDSTAQEFIRFCEQAECTYKYLQSKGCNNQQARTVLPNSTATIIVMTAYLSEWGWIEYLRTAPSAYPPIQKLMTEVWKQMIEAGIITTK